MPDLIEIQNVSKQFRTSRVLSKNKDTLAVNEVNLKISQGKSLGLIGESGSGKTTLGRMICALETVSKGEIYFKGNNITNLNLRKMKAYRKNIQMIFQNSSTIFDASYTVYESLKEVILNNEKVSKKNCDEKIIRILNQVGLREAHKNRYPYQLSGGEKQRVNIARALVINPEFVACDEPVSSLDFSVRKQILDLLNKLKKEMGLTYLFITHDLSTVKYVCDHVAVMYRGKIVELIDEVEHLAETVRHPYTKLLMNCIPTADPSNRKICIDQDEAICFCMSDRTQSGCAFLDRCPCRKEICFEKEPDLKSIHSGHMVACHMINDKMEGERKL
ncbi:ABC transporter ATP-binding protein [Sinanaerobacter sp. ZZT-01]|uniref:ABC transporter ATP-binding protein n=1 Tax=Sinanaerobacter sp. ZZT-01 TaxID=3111540 RepID=UPI002D79E70F|nr:ABC transporter ATP-binding protein [Sinanaerobacter sp. ZZT-01]WRR93028.1 ABC transporter ATP-binding protein [Sinanaerobacter sp. ZZT-01]